MKKKLKGMEKAMLLPHINNVLSTGKSWEDGNLHHPAGAIIAAVESIKGVTKLDGEESFTTNGWQWDWWQEFEYKGKKYTLGGSGFYGGHTFGLTDE